MKHMMRVFVGWLIILTVIGIPAFVWASGHGGAKADENRAAIVIANFGTTVPSAMGAIINIMDEVKKAFPETPVKITFTSNIIRSVWKKRQAEAQKWLDQGIPKEILYVKNIIATIGELLEDGYRDIIVQPTHVFFMEQSHDLAQYIHGLNSIRTMKAKWQPFHKLVMGRPALGMPGDRYSYHADLEVALKTLSQDVAMAKEKNAMLVYMAHGNDHWSTGIYMEAAKKMRTMYPQVVTYMGAVEGYPGLDDVCRFLSHYKSGNILLKPFMIVAGDHAMNDMASDEPDSWKSVLTSKGFQVFPVLEGLGANDQFARIFVDHIKDVAKDNGIQLK